MAGLLFGCMGVFVKLGAAYFSSAELVFYRSLIGLVVIYLIIKIQGLSLTTSSVLTLPVAGSTFEYGCIHTPFSTRPPSTRHELLVESESSLFNTT